MLLPYTRFKLKSGYVHRPALSIILYYGSRSILTQGILYTGSDITLVNKAFGENFGIDFKRCKNGQAMGISGLPQKTWIMTLDMEVSNLPKSRKTVEVEFIDSPSVGVLLGHKGFFENFVVRFETYCLMFEVENNP